MPFSLELRTEVKGNSVKGGDLHLVLDGLAIKADVLARLGVIIQNGKSAQELINWGGFVIRPIQKDVCVHSECE